MTVGLVITSAGMGTRFGGALPKQFMSMDGVPMLVHTCRLFEGVASISRAVITVTPGWESWVANALELAKLNRVFDIVSGGETRAISVMNGVRALEGVSHVMIHDSARPYASLDLIHRVIRTGAGAPAVIPGVGVVDTIKRVENGVVVSTLDRSVLVAVQTPQMFRRDILMQGYTSPRDFSAITDESTMVEALGYPVVVVVGEGKNTKVTYAEDLAGS
jgi:2-C-methyl-D-erythritol 4-phosphate cytidylyltransferase